MSAWSKYSFAAARLFGLQVRGLPGTWMSVGECCVLSGRVPCVGLTSRAEESHRMCVCVCLSGCDREG